jgi:probable HAF family extracellular repeat protein
LLTVSARGEAPYQFIVLDAPFANTQGTSASGINNLGQVVGVYASFSGTQHGFLYSDGQFETLDVPHSTDTQALGINDRGDIVGLFTDDRGAHGFRYDGLFATIDVPFGTVTATAAYGINRRGQIVGSYSDGHASHGFLYEKRHFTTIDVPDALGTVAFRISDEGQIVGSFYDGIRNHGFLYDDGIVTTIDVPFAEVFDDGALGINSRRQIVGYYQTGTPQMITGLHAFLDDEGTFTTIDVPGGIDPTALDLNRSGQIVGDFVDSAARSTRRGFIATPRHRVHDRHDERPEGR